MKNKVFTILFCSIWFSGCTSGPTPIPDAESDAAILYATRCGACHAVPHPKRNTITEWQHLLSLMEQRMKERGIKVLSSNERETLLAYLKSNAR